MWICVKSIEREIELVGTGDTIKEILDVMHNDMCQDLETEDDLLDAISDEEAEFNTETMTAWSTYKNVNRDWKCFWV